MIVEVGKLSEIVEDVQGVYCVEQSEDYLFITVFLREDYQWKQESGQIIGSSVSATVKVLTSNLRRSS